jgi:hypothetical protein
MHNDMWNNYLKYRQALANDVLSFLSNVNADKIDELDSHDEYATAMARIHYMGVFVPLPKAADIAAPVRYWKQSYNIIR